MAIRAHDGINLVIMLLHYLAARPCWRTVGNMPYLRVKQSVAVISVRALLVQAVVATARVVHIHVPEAQRYSHTQQTSEAQ